MRAKTSPTPIMATLARYRPCLNRSETTPSRQSPNLHTLDEKHVYKPKLLSSHETSQIHLDKLIAFPNLNGIQSKCQFINSDLENGVSLKPVISTSKFVWHVQGKWRVPVNMHIVSLSLSYKSFVESRMLGMLHCHYTSQRSLRGDSFHAIVNLRQSFRDSLTFQHGIEISVLYAFNVSQFGCDNKTLAL